MTSIVRNYQKNSQCKAGISNTQISISFFRLEAFGKLVSVFFAHEVISYRVAIGHRKEETGPVVNRQWALPLRLIPPEEFAPRLKTNFATPVFTWEMELPRMTPAC